MRRSISISALLGATLWASSAGALVIPEHRGNEASGALVAPAGLPPLRHEVRADYGAAPRALRDADRESLIKWISSDVLAIDCNSTPNPGRFLVRRLNNREYANTIRDLLYLPADWDAAADSFTKAIDNLSRFLQHPRLHRPYYLEMVQQPEVSRRLLELHPENFMLWMTRGVARANRREWAPAAADYTKALELMPEDRPQFLRALMMLTLADLHLLAGNEEDYRELRAKIVGRTKNVPVDFDVIRTARAVGICLGD